MIDWEAYVQDLTELKNQVANREIVPLLDEAVRAYHSGAYRAAIVSLWIAVAADLAGKIRVLAETGDKRAGQLIGELDEALARARVVDLQRFEKSLLDVACDDLQIISGRDRVELTRISEDRNLCAHPGFHAYDERFEPSAELVRAHIVAASRAALSREPVAGKNLIDVLQAEIETDAWPKPGRLVEYVDDRYVSRATRSARNAIVDLAIKGALQPDGVSERTALRCAGMVRALNEIDPSSVAERLGTVLANRERTGKLDNAALLRSLGAFGLLGAYGEALPATARTRLAQVLGDEGLTTLIDNRAFVGGAPVDQELGRLFEARLSEFDENALERVRDQGAEPAPLIPVGLRLLRRSDSFAESAERMSVIATLAGGLEAADVDELASIIDTHENDQIWPSRDVEEHLISAYRGSDNDRADIQSAWSRLAVTLCRPRDGNYYGRSDPPYSDLQEEVEQER